MIKVKKISLAPADIYALNGAPLTVLPAPIAGKVNNLLGISHDLQFNTLDYVGATLLYYYPLNAPDSIIFTDTISLQAGENFNESISRANTQPALVNPNIKTVPSIYSTKEAIKLTTDAVASVGNSPIDIYIIYETITLD